MTDPTQSRRKSRSLPDCVMAQLQTFQPTQRWLVAMGRSRHISDCPFEFSRGSSWTSWHWQYRLPENECVRLATKPSKRRDVSQGWSFSIMRTVITERQYIFFQFSTSINPLIDGFCCHSWRCCRCELVLEEKQKPLASTNHQYGNPAAGKTWSNRTGWVEMSDHEASGHGNSWCYTHYTLTYTHNETVHSAVILHRL